jgi:hypothetical protein
MRRVGLWLIVLLILMFVAAPVAQAEKRIALVIGDQNYQSAIGPLKNPHNDIARVGAALQKVGFDVATIRDAGFAELNRAVNAYIRRLNAAGPEAIGFFYYSGHGAQNRENGTNYLIPVHVKTIDVELWDASFRLKSVTDALKEQAPNATHFVVFDACRNTLRLVEPGSKALVQAKGFDPVRVVPGMLIAYATAEGDVASDVGEGVGPYARFLAEEIVKPDVEAVTMFRSVQLRVRDTIRQEPWLSYGALSPVWFAGRNEARPAVLPPPAPARMSEEAEAWAAAKEMNSIAALEDFIVRYKNSYFAFLAKLRLELKQQVAVATSPAVTKPVPLPPSTEKQISYTQGTSLAGVRISSSKQESIDRCRRVCLAEANCKGFDFESRTGICRLYSVVYGELLDGSVVAGKLN